ncbi:AMP-binding protein, partial [Streptomyces nojiriensis]
VYCPLSPSDPPARLGLLLERLAPALVLTGDGAPALPEALPTARIDAPVLPPAHGTAELPGTAYVIHTSGSTGTPKPVAVGHAALVHHLTAAADRFGLTTSDRVLMFAQPSFDVALEEVLPALHAGACLVLPEHEVPTGAELAELLASARVTVANLPTSYFLATREDLRPVLRDESWAPRLLVL